MQYSTTAVCSTVPTRCTGSRLASSIPQLECRFQSYDPPRDTHQLPQYAMSGLQRFTIRNYSSGNTALRTGTHVHAVHPVTLLISFLIVSTRRTRALSRSTTRNQAPSRGTATDDLQARKTWLIANRNTLAGLKRTYGKLKFAAFSPAFG